MRSLLVSPVSRASRTASVLARGAFSAPIGDGVSDSLVDRVSDFVRYYVICACCSSCPRVLIACLLQYPQASCRYHRRRCQVHSLILTPIPAKSHHAFPQHRVWDPRLPQSEWLVLCRPQACDFWRFHAQSADSPTLLGALNGRMGLFFRGTRQRVSSRARAS